MIYRDDLAYIHHDGFTEFIESASMDLLEILWRAGIRDGLVIDVGCGSGVLARELTRAGFETLGIDASPAMLALARNVAPRARFVEGTFGEAELPPARAIVAAGEVLNYGTLDQARAFFARAANALVSGGLLIFDVAERGSYAAHDTHQVDGADWSVIVARDSDGETLTRRIISFREVDGTPRRSDEVHTLSLYARADILRELRAAGFAARVRRGYGATRLPRGHAVFVCTRRG
ncbi:MAG TPA: class I SAM-dependent methyltransferase [Thermoanaerobaculia bacterium]